VLDFPLLNQFAGPGYVVVGVKELEAGSEASLAQQGAALPDPRRGRSICQLVLFFDRRIIVLLLLLKYYFLKHY
jgi:hypothetical protein